MYKENQPGVQLSSPEVWDSSCVICELILADVTGDGTNEIILTTDHNLVVFGYVGAEIKQLAYKDNIIEPRYWIWSMAVADVNDDSKNDILLGVNPVGYDPGYLFMYELVDPPDSDGLSYSLKQISDFYQCSDRMRILSLAAGDSDSVNGPDKICATAFQYADTEERIYQNYLLIWDFGDWNSPRVITVGEETDTYWFRLDVGDVVDGEYTGDEIALLRPDLAPEQLELHSLSALLLSEDGVLGSPIRTTSATPSEVNPDEVYIANWDGDLKNEIVCVGAVAQKSGKDGKGATCGSYYYIEVFGIDPDSGNIFSEWYTIGGDRCRDEAPWDASIG